MFRHYRLPAWCYNLYVRRLEKWAFHLEMPASVVASLFLDIEIVLNMFVGQAASTQASWPNLTQKQNATHRAPSYQLITDTGTCSLQAVAAYASQIGPLYCWPAMCQYTSADDWVSTLFIILYGIRWSINYMIILDWHIFYSFFAWHSMST